MSKENSQDNEIDIVRVMEMIPHRYPFLLVDKVLEIDGYKSGTVLLKKDIDSSKQAFDGEADKMKSSLQSLGEFHDSYSQELQKALQSNLDYSDPVFQTNQEIQESRIKALESQVSEIEILKMKVLNKQDSLLRSIICRANSTKLNVQPIMAGPNPTGSFFIFLNDGCLKFTENGSQVEITVREIRVRGRVHFSQVRIPGREIRLRGSVHFWRTGIQTW